ncbi:MAG TPA: GIY-YIG nuclease family protein, partial [Ignavibacteria bacterium]|nr:GIY-YIG nuclease family protein [Ignavibacteria bacterium]HMQ99183.1 GIY-YIG nuclease family protein [Ignavibacteria bacterium]
GKVCNPPLAGESDRRLRDYTMYFVYILFSLKDMKRYTGYTENISMRLQEHNNGLVRSTRNRRPLILIYKETYPQKKDAMERERFFKTGKGREFLNSVIKNNSPLPFL